LTPENNLNVSSSKVKYADIAPKVGLNPGLAGKDIPTFEIFCARLPNSVFAGIYGDLQAFSWQYGTLSMHDNEEARAHFLSGYFNKIVALFSGLLSNTPEAMLEGKITTKGRIEYQFKTYGGITVVFIQVKVDIGSLTERLNCYAQVIAECDGKFRMTLVKYLVNSFRSRRLDELSEWIQRAYHGDTMPWGLLLFLQVRGPTTSRWSTTILLGQVSKRLLATTHC
jgi:hypothetical protein